MVFYGVAILVISALAAGTHLRIPVPKLDGRIVGGQAIAIEHAAYQVSVQVWNQHICGATIIDRYWALTAAHCIFRDSEDGYSIRAGSSNHREGGQVYKVAEIIVHENYDTATHDYDYALLLLERAIETSSRMQVAPLADRDPKEDDWLLVTGWGALSSGGSAPEVLQGVYVPSINWTQCRIDYQRYTLTPRMICTGYEEGGKDACQGDSGGPLVTFGVNGNPLLVGIVSWGVGCASPKLPGVYASVAYSRAWILKHIKSTF